MASKEIKSKNFDANLDAKRMLNQIEQNLNDISFVAKENGNAGAPLDTGRLRKSSRITRKQFKKVISWNTPYANRRYYENDKNPHTREWAKKDAEKNEEKYLKLINRDVIL